MKQPYVVLLGLLTGFTPAFAQQKATFSIDDVLSAPYCSNLTAGRSRVAWVVTTEGVRNIFTSAVATTVGKPTQLTRSTVDDGQDLGDLRFSPDDTQVAYVRGGGKNGEGVSPNPTSDPAGAEQAIYVVPVDGSQPPVRIAVGSHPAWSPDGTRLLFGQGGQVQVCYLKAPKAPTTEKLFSVRGSVSDISWSPDGTKVLFRSDRGYHSLIGVYDIAQKTVAWLAPGVDRDGYPVWSPDGRQVAFIRQPGKKHGELENIQGGNRFAIWTADMATGEGRELWHSPGEDGGFAQYYPAEPLRWTAANQILFFSEHDRSDGGTAFRPGWMHVYKLAPDGKTPPVDLTPGAYEAEETFVTADGKQLYFSSNNPVNDRLDTDRRHIWRVSLLGGKPEAVTRGTGIETDPVVVNGYVVYRSASWNRSTGIAGQKSGDATATVVFPTGTEPDAKRFPASALVEPKQVIFNAADGVEVHGQLFLPKALNSSAQRSADRRPALIFMHGGPIRQMLLGWHYRGTYYGNTYAMNQYLASQGYVVLSVNYRAGIGYGRAFRLADRQGPRGASEYQDILAGAKYLQSRADVDPLRIGLWGGSYGGYLTALGLARNSDLFAAGVDLHGVHDWSWRGNMFSPGGGWGIGPAESKVAFESSPNHNLDFWRSPCLFVHGDDDRNVTFAETVDLVQKLRDRHVSTEVLIFPDDVHGFLLHKNWVRTCQAMDAFLGKWLHQRTAPAAPTK